MALETKQYLQDLAGPQNPNTSKEQNPNIAFREKQAKQINNDRVNAYLDKLPDGVELAKIPPKYKGSVQKWAFAKKSEIAKLKLGIKNTPAGSPQNLQLRQMVQEKESAFENLNNQLTNYHTYKDEYLKTSYAGNLSDANNPDKVNMLSGIYTDKMDIVISDSGDLMFENDGGAIKFNDLPDYTVKDNNAAGEILNMNEQAFKLKAPLSKGQEQIYRLKLNKMMNNRDTVKSLAMDDFIMDGGLGLSRDLIYDDSRSEELKQIVTDSYLDMFKNTALDSYNTNQSRGRFSGGTASSRKYKARLDNINAGWEALGQGDPSVLNRTLSGNDELVPLEEEEGLYTYYNGSKEIVVDPNDPNDLQYILSGQNIPDDMWPKTQKPSGGDAQSLIEKYSK